VFAASRNVRKNTSLTSDSPRYRTSTSAPTPPPAGRPPRRRDPATHLDADVAPGRELGDDVRSIDELLRPGRGEPLPPKRHLELPGLDVDRAVLRGVPRDEKILHARALGPVDLDFVSEMLPAEPTGELGAATRDVEQSLAIAARGPPIAPPQLDTVRQHCLTRAKREVVSPSFQEYEIGCASTGSVTASAGAAGCASASVTTPKMTNPIEMRNETSRRRIRSIVARTT